MYESYHVLKLCQACLCAGVHFIYSNETAAPVLHMCAHVLLASIVFDLKI